MWLIDWLASLVPLVIYDEWTRFAVLAKRHGLSSPVELEPKPDPGSTGFYVLIKAKTARGRQLICWTARVLRQAPINPQGEYDLWVQQEQVDYWVRDVAFKLQSALPSAEVKVHLLDKRVLHPSDAEELARRERTGPA